MTNLARLTLENCNMVSPQLLHSFFTMDNQLGTVRIWTCPLVTAEAKTELHAFVTGHNLDLYFEWFE